MSAPESYTICTFTKPFIFQCRKTTNEPSGEYKDEDVFQMTPNGVETTDGPREEDSEILAGDDLVPSQR
jgi:hypothetical protein